MTATTDVTAAEIQTDKGLCLPLYAERAFLTYAMSVVKARALPQIEDGQKPVQRRILYAMADMGLRHTGTNPPKCVKSARVVGDVIGKYHPHGDTSIYDAMVRVAQDFSLRYPLVDGQGNFGSRDGDGAAAMRYTEARLTPISELLLSELDKGTVDFIPNYDGAFFEPALLPARLPFMLLNGAKGPAVGYRPEIPSHNLREVAAAASMVISSPNATFEEIFAVFKGPDFPGGGQIISSPASIEDAYRTGHGSVRMRARWHREDLARGQYRIIVDELPHGVSCASVLSEIEAVSNPPIKAGKKELSQDQKNLKALVLGVLDVARDESKKTIRLVLEPKTGKTDENDLMRVLLAHTSMEFSIPIDLVSIGLDGKPAQKNLCEILSEWGQFRVATVSRRTSYRLGQIRSRLHILEGRLIAFNNVERVVQVIRTAEDPKADLMAVFALSLIQAEDILDIRLRQLARLERTRLEGEMATLHGEEASLQLLLDHPAMLVKQVVREIAADAKTYGDDRRTLIEEVEAIRPSAVAALADDPITVTVSKLGWIRARQGHRLDRASHPYKQGDAEGFVLETRTSQEVIFIDNNGRAYSVKGADVPNGRGDGAPLASLVDFQLGENGSGVLSWALAGSPEDLYLFGSSTSYGFLSKLSSLVASKKAGKAFMALCSGARMLRPVAVTATHVVTIAAGKASRMSVFPVSEMKVLPGGKGVIIMDVGADGSLAQMGMCDGTRVHFHADSNPIVIEGDALTKYQGHRARKGAAVPGSLTLAHPVPAAKP